MKGGRKNICLAHSNAKYLIQYKNHIPFIKQKGTDIKRCMCSTHTQDMHTHTTHTSIKNLFQGRFHGPHRNELFKVFSVLFTFCIYFSLKIGSACCCMILAHTANDVFKDLTLCPFSVL